MVLAVAGNFDWDQICSTAQTNCGIWQKQPVSRKLDQAPASKKKERLGKSNLSREHICLMSRGLSAQDPKRFAASLLTMIVGDDVGSRFFWELVDNALAETATIQLGAMDGTGVFCSYIRCGNENVGKVLDTVRSIFSSLSSSGITEDELTKAKNKILSALVIKNELPMGRLIDLGFNWTYLQQYRTVADDINAIKTVTVNEIHSVIEKYNLGDFTQLSLGPAQ